MHTHFGGSNVAVAGPGQIADNSASANNWTYTPRIWIGKQGCRWGFIGRFWYLSDGDSQLNPLVNGFNNAGLNGSNRLKAYTVDLEITRQFLFNNNSRIVGSLGARYASLSNDGSLNSDVAVPFDAALYNAFASSSTRFNGTGVVGSIYGKRPVRPALA